ncbi:MAG: hypothetical protein FJ388_14500 [Verrucomicrobia bacterium]|nr:hypothetical protein [Verrucomicrobiota bacterium]
MKLLLDHDVPDEAARLLRHWGHDVLRLRDVLPITTPDGRIFEHAQTQGWLIVSCNRSHFLAHARRVIQHQTLFAGLVILIRRRTRQAECAHLLSLLRRAGEAGLSGNINFA